MDLLLVKKKLEAGAYAAPKEFKHDVNLVWGNCMTYNADGSEYYNVAQNLKKIFEEKYSKQIRDESEFSAAARRAIRRPPRPAPPRLPSDPPLAHPRAPTRAARSALTAVDDDKTISALDLIKLDVNDIFLHFDLRRHRTCLLPAPDHAVAPRPPRRGRPADCTLTRSPRFCPCPATRARRACRQCAPCDTYRQEDVRAEPLQPFERGPWQGRAAAGPALRVLHQEDRRRGHRD